jgi:hypothetical protein
MNYSRKTIFDLINTKKHVLYETQPIFIISPNFPILTINFIADVLFKNYTKKNINKNEHKEDFKILSFDSIVEEEDEKKILLIDSYTYENNNKNIDIVKRTILDIDSFPAIIHIDNFFAKQLPIHYHETFFYCDTKIEKNSLEQLCSLFDPTDHANIKELFVLYDTVSWEFLIDVMRYAPYMKKNLWTEHAGNVFKKNVIQTYSLFDMIGFFFLKNSNFFEVWECVYQNYEFDFWVYYWNDYVSLCIMFIETMKKNIKISKELEIQFRRLPRQLTQYQWKYLSPKSLSNSLYILNQQNALLHDVEMNSFLVFEKMFIHWFYVS